MKKSLKNTLKLARIKAGLTQKDLARKLGFSPSTIGMYEQGRRKPNYNTLTEISGALGISIFDFFPNQRIFNVDVVLQSIIECLNDTKQAVFLHGEFIDEQKKKDIVHILETIITHEK